MNIRTAENNCFSRNLKYLRKSLSISQQRVAEQVKKGQTTIANWENRVSEPSIDELLLLTNFFGIDIADLIRTDLEKSGLVTDLLIAKFRQRMDAVVPAGARQKERKRSGYEEPERQDALVQEDTELSAWVLLRMLRIIDEKIEGIRELVEKKSRGGK